MLKRHSTSSTDFNDYYMHEALSLARRAEAEGDVPVGAVIVNPESQEIIGRGYNTSNINGDPTLHAEMIAIKEACDNLQSKLLQSCYIYVTLEPCAMCATAISYAQLARVYYGATDPKFGAIESNLMIYNSTLTLWIPEVYGGICREESAKLLVDYFKNKRFQL
jgi:tRNA(Arg) A34 adenosine deaminase TadA